MMKESCDLNGLQACPKHEYTRLQGSGLSETVCRNLRLRPTARRKQVGREKKTLLRNATSAAASVPDLFLDTCDRANYEMFRDRSGAMVALISEVFFGESRTNVPQTFRQCLDGVFVTTPSRKFLVERLHTCLATAGPRKDKTLFVYSREPYRFPGRPELRNFEGVLL